MTFTKRHSVVTAAVVLVALSAGGQSDPRIGYIYPAGGQQGAVFQVVIGGQQLRGAQDVHISGDGVRATVDRYCGRLNLNGDQGRELLRQIAAAERRLRAESGGTPAREKKENAKADMPVAKLPDHPLLDNIEGKDLREIAYLKHLKDGFRKRQQNAQIAETLVLTVEVDASARPGDRELRVVTKNGVTNPMCFQVGTLPEYYEKELNDPDSLPGLPAEPALDLPVVLNGQVLPGDVDRFRVHMRQGQKLVLDVEARKLVPYLADAVPGWFQAVLVVYNAKGEEVAFADDYRFSPDPVLYYEVPEDGEYEVEVRDSIYRGREDFVYRVSIAEQPYVTAMYPLGGALGQPTVSRVDGWNLPDKHVRLNTEGLEPGIHEVTLDNGRVSATPVLYDVDILPEDEEFEPNNTAETAQRIEFPRIVNGRIDAPGDIDVFAFEGAAGDTVVLEVLARRLRSPLDALLRLSDASGQEVAWNDDSEDKASGLLTHHADPYVRAELPVSGTYYVKVCDAQNNGGDASAYRLRLAPPRPDFALRMCPSTVNITAGRSALVTVHALRKDGFDGEIEVVLKDAPPGFMLDGPRIPAGRDSMRMTLSAPAKATAEPITIQLEGRATIAGSAVARPIIPAEDMMQAFAYRHLVPAQNLVVSVQSSRFAAKPVRLDEQVPVTVPCGGAANVMVKVPPFLELATIELALSQPPEGVSLGEVKVMPEGVAFAVQADGTAAKAGLSDNLIVEAFVYAVQQDKNRQPTEPKRTSVGILPAIPFQVAAQ